MYVGGRYPHRYEFIQEHSKDEGFHVKDMRMVLEGVRT